MASPKTNPQANTSTGVPAKSEAAFPPFDTSTFSAQLIWLTLIFGFLYYMLARHLLPRIREVIEEREATIKRDLQEAERLKGETDSALASYEKALSDAKSKASGIAKATRDSLAAETDKERHAVDAQLAAKIADAEKRIGASKSKAMASVNDVAAEAVGAIVNKLTGQTIGRDDINRALAAIKK